MKSAAFLYAPIVTSAKACLAKTLRVCRIKDLARAESFPRFHRTLDDLSSKPLAPLMGGVGLAKKDPFLVMARHKRLEESSAPDRNSQPGVTLSRNQTSIRTESVGAD